MKDCKHCRMGWFDGKYGQDVECVNGVLIDIDEAHDGQSDLVYPLAPCHPNFKTQSPNDSMERLEVWRSIIPPASDAVPDGEEDPLTEAEKAKIDAAWEIHKAANPMTPAPQGDR